MLNFLSIMIISTIYVSDLVKKLIFYIINRTYTMLQQGKLL